MNIRTSSSELMSPIEALVRFKQGNLRRNWAEHVLKELLAKAPDEAREACRHVKANPWMYNNRVLALANVTPPQVQEAPSAPTAASLTVWLSPEEEALINSRELPFNDKAFVSACGHMGYGTRANQWLEKLIPTDLSPRAIASVIPEPIRQSWFRRYFECCEQFSPSTAAAA